MVGSPTLQALSSLLFHLTFDPLLQIPGGGGGWEEARTPAHIHEGRAVYHPLLHYWTGAFSLDIL